MGSNIKVARISFFFSPTVVVIFQSTLNVGVTDFVGKVCPNKIGAKDDLDKVCATSTPVYLLDPAAMFNKVVRRKG